MSPEKSPIWKYFAVSGNSAQCGVCMETLTTGTGKFNGGNLERHLRTEHSTSDQYKKFQLLKVDWLAKRRSKPYARVPIRSEQERRERKRTQTREAQRRLREREKLRVVDAVPQEEHVAIQKRDASVQTPEETTECRVSIYWNPNMCRLTEVEIKLDNGSFRTIFEKSVDASVDDSENDDGLYYAEYDWSDDLKAAGAAVGKLSVSWLDLRGGDKCNFEFDDLVTWIPTLLSAEKLYMLYDPTFCKLDQVENVLPLFPNLTKAYVSYDGREDDYDIDWRLLRTPSFLRLHSLRLDLPKNQPRLTLPTKDFAEDEILRYCNDFSALPDGQEKLVYLSGVSVPFVGRLLETRTLHMIHMGTWA